MTLEQAYWVSPMSSSHPCMVVVSFDIFSDRKVAQGKIAYLKYSRPIVKGRMGQQCLWWLGVCFETVEEWCLERVNGTSGWQSKGVPTGVTFSSGFVKLSDHSVLALNGSVLVKLSVMMVVVLLLNIVLLLTLHPMMKIVGCQILNERKNNENVKRSTSRYISLNLCFWV